ncbi:hypothetical protein LXL04_021475 [Taraxacum kok-saghyz]
MSATGFHCLILAMFLVVILVYNRTTTPPDLSLDFSTTTITSAPASQSATALSLSFFTSASGKHLHRCNTGDDENDEWAVTSDMAVCHSTQRTRVQTLPEEITTASSATQFPINGLHCFGRGLNLTPFPQKPLGGKNWNVPPTMNASCIGLEINTSSFEFDFVNCSESDSSSSSFLDHFDKFKCSNNNCLRRNSTQFVAWLYVSPAFGVEVFRVDKDLHFFSLE